MTVLEKANRIRSGAALQIKWATDQLVQARVRGDHGVYDVRWTRLQGWGCSCPAYGRCSHAEAVASVTMRRISERKHSQVDRSER
jgi:uncharacterized Zn finger protein